MHRRSPSVGVFWIGLKLQRVQGAVKTVGSQQLFMGA
jgi:hypothetical protein